MEINSQKRNRKTKGCKIAGFSLIEVNMAVFVMAVGIVAMAALYPLGLRESIQSTADLRQSMFADVVLGAAVAAASSTNITWTQDFSSVALAQGNNKLDQSILPKGKIGQTIKNAITAFNNGAKIKMVQDKNYRIYCFRLRDNPCVMGFMVFSIDMDVGSMNANDLERLLSNQQVYYAEALFQGVE
jgi:hypothetical protein